MVLIFFENFAWKLTVETLTITNFEHFSLGDVDTLTIKIEKQKFFGRVKFFEVLSNYNLQIILSFIKNVRTF